MQYRLRTLLILLAVMPPIIAGAWQGYERYSAYRDQQRALSGMDRLLATYRGEIPIGYQPQYDSSVRCLTSANPQSDQAAGTQVLIK